MAFALPSMLVVLAAVAAAGVAWVLYRAFIFPLLDPLRSIPGPKSHPVFGVVGRIMKEQTCAPQLEWVEKHGKTVLYRRMLGAPAVLTVDPTIIKRVLVSESKRYKKGERQTRILRRALGNGLVTSQDPDHAKHRGLIKRHFEFSQLKAVFPVFVRTAHRLADHWAAEWAGKDKQLDVIGAMSKYTLDVIGLSAFGYHFNATAHPDGEFNRAVGDMLPHFDIWLLLSNLLPFFNPICKALGLGPFRKTQNAINKLRGKVAELVESRSKLIADIQAGKVSDSGERTLLDIMIQDTYKDGTKMSPLELADQTMTFLLAGHETTSNALTWTWYLLAKHPHVEKKLREEVIAAFPDGLDDVEHFTADALSRMPYLWAVCQESLRMYPPVPITNRVAATDDVWNVNGTDVKIPKGTPVFLLPYVLHHQPDLWEDPEVFKPERWYVDEAMQTRARPKPFTFMPFLFGDRSCIGQRFAVMEMQASLAILVRRFSLRMIPGAPDPKRRLTITMRPSPNLQMTVHAAE